MESLVPFFVQDGVGVVTINNPPVNALSSGVLEGLKVAVETLEGNAAVRTIVVIGCGRTFVAGADINQFVEIIAGRGAVPAFHPVLFAIEDCAQPVVMAIHGTALGGGLELAVAGHYRVAVPDAQVGQPEVKIGLIPGAGGTQRLPRLAGVAKAVEMCAFGAPVKAQEALASGIVDRIMDDNLRAGAVAFAQEIAEKPFRKTRDLNDKVTNVDPTIFSGARE